MYISVVYLFFSLFLNYNYFFCNLFNFLLTILKSLQVGYIFILQWKWTKKYAIRIKKEKKKMEDKQIINNKRTSFNPV